MIRLRGRIGIAFLLCTIEKTASCFVVLELSLAIILSSLLLNDLRDSLIERFGARIRPFPGRGREDGHS